MTAGGAGGISARKSDFILTGKGIGRVPAR